MNHQLGLEPTGYTNDGTNPINKDSERITYRVTGLTPLDECRISIAGTANDGKRAWRIRWSRADQDVPLPDAVYNSPEAALAVVEEIAQ